MVDSDRDSAQADLWCSRDVSRTRPTRFVCYHFTCFHQHAHRHAQVAWFLLGAHTAYPHQGHWSHLLELSELFLLPLAYAITNLSWRRLVCFGHHLDSARALPFLLLQWNLLFHQRWMELKPNDWFQDSWLWKISYGFQEYWPAEITEILLVESGLSFPLLFGLDWLLRHRLASLGPAAYKSLLGIRRRRTVQCRSWVLNVSKKLALYYSQCFSDRNWSWIFQRSLTAARAIMLITIVFLSAIR